MKTALTSWAFSAPLLALVLLGVAGTPVRADAQPSTPSAKAMPSPRKLSQLLRLFRDSPGVSADYTEEKRIVLLRAPLLSSGSLYYSPQQGRARLVRRPQKSRLLLTGEQMIVVNRHGRKAIPVQGHEVMRALVNSFLHVFRGDKAALERSFRLAFRTEGKGWELLLTARTPAVARHIKNIRVAGRGAELRSIGVTETSGDATEMRFTKIRPARRFTPAEKNRYFSSAAK